MSHPGRQTKIFWYSCTILVLLNSGLGTVRAKELRNGQEESSPVELRYQKSTINYLRRALKPARGAARIYYSAPCHGNDSDGVPFPRLKVQPPSGGTSALAAVREVFARDKRVTVATDSSGIVRLDIGKPLPTLLATKIPLLTFDVDEQYTPILAVGAILRNKQVERAMQNEGLKVPTAILNVTVQEPNEGLPHLPASLTDTTVDQALELIAKTFGGISVYGVCEASARPRIMWMEFIPVAGTEADKP